MNWRLQFNHKGGDIVAEACKAAAVGPVAGVADAIA
jgi:hypothetical protein